MKDPESTTPKPQSAPRRKSRAKNPPLSSDERQRMVELRRHGRGLRPIAKALMRDRKTVRQALKEEGLVEPTAAKASVAPLKKLELFLEVIADKVSKLLTTSRILREIRELGYSGGRTILASLVRSLRAPLAPPRRAKRRFETRAGKELQVDWTLYTVPIAGQATKVYALVVVLAYSRKVHVHLYRDTRESTLLEGLAVAFEVFGGVTIRAVFDYVPGHIIEVRRQGCLSQLFVWKGKSSHNSNATSV